MQPGRLAPASVETTPPDTTRIMLFPVSPTKNIVPLKDATPAGAKNLANKSASPFDAPGAPVPASVSTVAFPVAFAPGTISRTRLPSASATRMLPVASTSMPLGPAKAAAPLLLIVESITKADPFPAAVDKNPLCKSIQRSAWLPPSTTIARPPLPSHPVDSPPVGGLPLPDAAGPSAHPSAPPPVQRLTFHKNAADGGGAAIPGAAQRPGHSQSMGGAAPPPHHEPGAHKLPKAATEPGLHAEPGGAVHGAQSAALVEDVNEEKVPWGQGVGAPLPAGQKKPMGQG